MVINWYPGHMVRARREIQENVKLVDIVAILLDARAPFSCRNQDLENIVQHKRIVYILNKADLADGDKTREYLQRLSREGYLAVAMDSSSGKGSREVLQAFQQAYQPIAEDLLQRGRRVRPARVMIVGVPNVGKSTFLNCLVGKKLAQTGAKPGVTRGKQWIRVREGLEFMDTPGLMWPKVENEDQGYRLALLDIVSENAYNQEEAALYLMSILKQYPPLLEKKLSDLPVQDMTELELLQALSRQRGHLLKGGELDLLKSSRTLLLEFRRGRWGKISLDE